MAKNFSNKYQAGALSFEFVSNGKKIITNSGYFNKNDDKLNEISRSSAVHNVLVIDDNSSCKFKKNSNLEYEIKDGLKIINKKVINEKNYWKINATHDGYLKKYNLFSESNTTNSKELAKLFDENLALARCLRDKGVGVADPTQEQPKLDLSALKDSKEELVPLLQECGNEK